MKHANTGSEQQMDAEEGGSQRWSFGQMSQQMSDGATRIAGKARENPGAALAVGGAVIGAVAAAAVPLFRWSRNGGTTEARQSAAGKKSNGTNKARGKKKS